MKSQWLETALTQQETLRHPPALTSLGCEPTGEALPLTVWQCKNSCALACEPDVAFGTVPDTEWHLNDRIGIDRKKRLLNTPLDEIISRMVTNAEFGSLKQEPYKKKPDLQLNRLSFKLRLPCQVVDLFHNGAGGYRAQYYLSVSEGEHANRFIITEIQEALKKYRAGLSKIQCSWEFIEASLCHPQAKIWIYEGRWLTDNTSVDRNLVVDRWKESANTNIWPYRFEASWVQLTPDSEPLLDFKGGWINAAFEHVLRGKEKRSSEIHLLGYT